MLGREPAVILGSLAEVIKAIIPMLIIFGFIRWTGEQVAQVMLVVGVGIGFLNVLLTRSQVVAATKSDALVEKALTMPSSANIGEVVAAEKKD